jgi:omega-hydroxypalmitate O-feruloyl transferase
MDKTSATILQLLQFESNINTYCFKIAGKVIKSLKSSLMNEPKSTQFTTHESLGVYISRAKSRALKLDENGKTMLNMLVGMRGNMENPSPTGYYGNTIVDANVILNVRQLNEKLLYETTQLFKDGRKAVYTNEFVQKYIDNALQTNHAEDLT